MISRWPSAAIRREAAALWLLAWPVLVGQVATVAMGVVDVAMTGHASAEDLAAVSLGASIWSIVVVTIMGILMAVNTLVAHKVGAGSTAQIPHLVRQALWKSLFIGILAWGFALAATLVHHTVRQITLRYRVRTTTQIQGHTTFKNLMVRYIPDCVGGRWPYV